jgi:protease-4
MLRSGLPRDARCAASEETLQASQWLVALLVVLGILFGLLSLAFLDRDDMTSPWSEGGVGLVVLAGEIQDAESFVEELDAQKDDRRAKALVVRIDSPGGDVGASQEMYEALRRFRSETDRPVIVSVGDLAASGGYYVACAADAIVANPGSLTGSIGVIMSFANAEGLLARIGLSFRVIKSGEMKDQGAFWRDLTPEEQQLLQGMVDDVHRQFVDVVRQARALSEDEAFALADGRVFSGRQAFEVGLVDTLGDLSLALDLARERAGLSPDSPVITHQRTRVRWWELLMQGKLALPAFAEPGPRLQYRLFLPSGAGIVPPGTR